MREIFMIKEILAVLAGVSLKYSSISDGLNISKTEILEMAAQIKYRKTANGAEITEMILESDGNGVEMLKEICKNPAIPFGNDISINAGIYEESEEI